MRMKVAGEPNEGGTPGQLEMGLGWEGGGKVDLPHQPRYSECGGFPRWGQNIGLYDRAQDLQRKEGVVVGRGSVEKRRAK